MKASGALDASARWNTFARLGPLFRCHRFSRAFASAERLGRNPPLFLIGKVNNMSWHVYPTNDEREHVTDGSECWCQPLVEYIDPETHMPYPDGSLVIHNSADCREIVEEAERLSHE